MFGIFLSALASCGVLGGTAACGRSGKRGAFSVRSDSSPSAEFSFESHIAYKHPDDFARSGVSYVRLLPAASSAAQPPAVGAENAVRFLVRSDSSPSADHSFRFQPAYKIPDNVSCSGFFYKRGVLGGRARGGDWRGGSVLPSCRCAARRRGENSAKYHSASPASSTP